MAIQYHPKTGEVLICDFGPDFPRTQMDEIDQAALTPSGRLPPEMVKTRLVVVLNGKMGQGCMVVPLSSTKPNNPTKIEDGLYVFVDQALIPASTRFIASDRWAGGEQVQQVSKMRLQSYHPDKNHRPVLPPGVLELIQRAVVKAIRAANLMVPQAAAEGAAAAAPIAPPTPAPTGAMAAAMAAAMAKKSTLQVPTAAAAGAVQMEKIHSDDTPKAA